MNTNPIIHIAPGSQLEKLEPNADLLEIAKTILAQNGEILRLNEFLIKSIGSTAFIISADTQIDMEAPNGN